VAVNAETFRRVFRILRRRYPVEDWSRGRNPFDVLVSIMVSQNSTDLVTARVMGELRRRGTVTQGSVLAMPSRELVQILKPAGLAHQKVPRIRAVARQVLRDFGGELERLKEMDTAEARETLMAMPGVGPKTADVWLAMVARRDTMPVDTHIHRLARRWRLAPSEKYEDVAAALKELIPPRSRVRGHLVLIEFGREICHARRPACGRCPIYSLCDAGDRIRR
jgi:endonuclease-3